MPNRERPVVATTAGAVRGVRDAWGERYRAMPYAAGPVGATRFAAPMAHPGWVGVRDGTRPSPTAPQPERPTARLDLSPYFGPGWVRGAEYLTVDVRTPAADGQARPVMIFVHGGGFVAGSTQAALYDGRAFARDGVVLVTLNHRLGIPGFLDLADAPANRGLLDVLAALGWVRDNISAFGGDPANVTAFGQSAGATVIGALLAMPQAKGLLRRAIIQSGTSPLTPEQAQRVTAAAAEALGVAPTAEAFGVVADERLVEVLPKLGGLDLRTDTENDPFFGLSAFSVVLPRQHRLAFADGAGADVDLLIGNNTEEGHLYLALDETLGESTMDDVWAMAARAHSDPRAAVAALAAERPGATPAALMSAVIGEAMFGVGTEQMIDAHTAVSGGGRTFVYRFGYRSPALDDTLGAAHTIELPFVFDVVDEPWLHGDVGLLGPDAAPGDLAARVHGAWVEFARTGDPGWSAHADGNAERLFD